MKCIYFLFALYTLTEKKDESKLTIVLRDHIAELKNAKPKKPFFFLKPASSIILPGDGPCLQPKGVDMHFEVELALIIGSMVRNLHPEDEKGALEAIKGE